MADPVQKPDISPKPAAKAPPASPKAAAAAPKAAAPKAGDSAAKQPPQVKAKPKEAPEKQIVKPRFDSLNVNLGRSGLPQESAFPIQKDAKPAPAAAPKAAPAAKGAPVAAKPGAAPAGKPVPGAKPVAPAAKGAPVAAKPGAPAAPAAKAPPPPAPKPAVPAGGVAKPAAPRAKSHYFIIENLCVGCGLCIDKCPPKVKAIGYKFYGDVQEGGFRAYIDQDACISCASCFNSAECPAAALIEVLPDGQILDYPYTPPERLDFDLRFLHRFHREAR